MAETIKDFNRPEEIEKEPKGLAYFANATESVAVNTDSVDNFEEFRGRLFNYEHGQE